jgi:pSer/pThr/pTyr-binding forkhead associated (FHA) protein
MQLAEVAPMPSVGHPDVVLKPLSRPELGEIRIDDADFCIGRGEPPFASYEAGIANMLSRRHACIFSKDGTVYLRDLESRNGTSVNHVGVGRAPCELRDGDEICFADTLSYRVQIASLTRPEGSLTLTLTPESGASGLEPIVITRFPFIVSKTDATFSRYKNKKEHDRELGYLSRRHAHIYVKGGRAYIEDLGSGNGTCVDGEPLVQAVPLRDGAAVAFGGKHFVYRVSVVAEPGRGRAGSGGAETMVKDRSGVSETAASHAPPVLVEVACGGAAVEASAESLAECAAEAQPKAAVQPQAEPTAESQLKTAAEPQPRAAAEPQLVRAAEAQPKPTAEAQPKAAAEPPAKRQPSVPQALASNKTQFMAAPTSFLEVYCDASAPKDASAPGESAAPAVVAKEPPVSRRRRGRIMLLLSELASLRAGSEPDEARGGWWKGAVVVGILGALIWAVYWWNAPERDLRNALGRGEYVRAAALASQLLAKHPDDADLKALAADSTLKASVPVWLEKVRARDFDGARHVLTGMSDLAVRDAPVRPLIEELDWLGNFERLISDRGGPEAPVRIYADEDRIEHLIGGWNDDTGEHQRALARIASHVPQFGDFYGEALTYLRRMQSESTVYLPIIERLKGNIEIELQRDDPEALLPLLKETAAKYPSLGGLDSVRQDLASYIELRQEARTRKSGRVFALLAKANFVTPPFQQAAHALSENGQLPPAALLQQYAAATRVWKDGNSDAALDGLQKMTAGPWGDEAAKELERRQHVSGRFAELRQSHDANDYVDQLLTFRESLDPDEDVYFVRATAADLNQQKDTVIARAQDAMNKARTLWEEYRGKGAIDAAQRIETSISDQYRTCAHLLAEASRYAREGISIYAQVDPAGAAQWTGIRDEIEAEARQQRGRLNDLSNVVEPELLKTKLALLGEPSE